MHYTTFHFLNFKMSLIKDLNWRYATKNMSGKTVSKKKLEAILNIVNLAPTSYGLQPYTVIVVSKKSVKAKLQVAAYDQPQVGSSSHILVFAVPNQITAADVDVFINNVATTRGIPASVLAGYKDRINGTIGAAPAEQQQIWASKQAYIALGTALAAAAEQKVDACPMEGFNAAQFDTILGLSKKGLKSVVIMPIGFRAENDATAGFAKVRKPVEDMFHFVK
jgi:nitroreductase / dihydropteridine reductase